MKRANGACGAQHGIKGWNARRFLQEGSLGESGPGSYAVALRDSAAEGAPTSGRAVILATIGLSQKKARMAASRLQAKAVQGTGIQAPVVSSGLAVDSFGWGGKGDACHEAGDDAAAEHDDGNAEGQPEQDTGLMSLGRPCHGQQVVRTHDEVGHGDNPDRVSEVLGLPGGLLDFDVFHQELRGDPEDQGAAHEREEGHPEELPHEDVDGYANQDGSGCPEQDGLDTLPLGRPPGSHSDDHGVVPGQEDVDHDDPRLAPDGG